MRGCSPRKIVATKRAMLAELNASPVGNGTNPDERWKIGCIVGPAPRGAVVTRGSCGYRKKLFDGREVRDG